MGAASSLPKNEQQILEELQLYDATWESIGYPKEQTSTFRRMIPKEAIDFGETFREKQLDKVFTNTARLRLGEGFNCLNLFRTSLEDAHLPVYSNEKYTVQVPIGEPGRDQAPGDGLSGYEIGHFMVVPNSDEDGTYTCFNDMLPQSPDEIRDSEEKILMVDQVYRYMKDNSSISNCGEQVLKKAAELGLGEACGLRDYFIKMIVDMPEELRTGADGGPGFKLKDATGQDISTDWAKVTALVQSVFCNPDLTVFKLIQPPAFNTQIVSHMHSMAMDKVPDCMEETYRNLETVMAVKRRFTVMEGDGEDDGEMDSLCRQNTVAST